MLDMKLLRERTEFVRERLATRNAGDEAKVTEVLALDETRRTALAEAEQLKARRNSASKEIGGLIGQKRLEEAEARKAEVRTLGDRIAELDKTQAVLLICQSGPRANRAASELRRAGFGEVYVLSGGYTEWQSQGLPTAA